MSEIRVDPGALRKSAAVCTSAAGEISGAGSSQHLSQAGTAVPGADAIARFSTMGTFWDKQAKDTSEEARSYADSLVSAAAAAEEADREAQRGAFGLLGGLGG